MNLLQDIITYVRRLIKSPSNTQITDALIIDYINRFWLMDMDARVQLFDFKTTYQFQTIPGIDQYNMPMYNVQVEPGAQNITSFPVYQQFRSPVFVNGIQCPFYTDENSFYNLWPQYTQALAQAGTGNGTSGPYKLSVPFFPAIPGHLDITGIIATTGGNTPIQDPLFKDNFPVIVDPITGPTKFISIPSTSFYPGVYLTYTDDNGNNVTLADSGVFLKSATKGNLYGLLMQPGNPPFGNTVLGTGVGGDYSITQNTINYNTGQINVTFPNNVPAGTPIQAQCFFYESGIPRALLFWNNCMTLRPPPNTQYLVSVEAYLTPAAFLTTSQALPFAYMSEYVSRGAARKILSDTGDWEQFQSYEPLFIEQERLVWKRSQREFTAVRTATIFSETQGQTNYNNIGTGSN